MASTNNSSALATVMVNYQQVCRLCLSEDSLEDVFKHKDLQNLISKFLFIMISTEDNISQSICAGCRARLNEFREYQTRCLETQNVLIELETALKADGTVVGNDNTRPEDQGLGESEHQNGELIKCDECEMVFEFAEDLREHKSSVKHIKRRATNYTCASCSRTFSGQVPYAKHMLIHQMEGIEPTIKCDACDRKFHTTTQARSHYRVIHGPKKYACPICSREFIDRRSVQIHIGVHDNDHVCTVCSSKFQFKKQLNVHLIKSHGVIQQKEKIKNPQNPSRKRRPRKGRLSDEQKLESSATLPKRKRVSKRKPRKPSQRKGAKTVQHAAPQELVSVIEVAESKIAPELGSVPSAGQVFEQTTSEGFATHPQDCKCNNCLKLCPSFPKQEDQSDSAMEEYDEISVENAKVELRGDDDQEMPLIKKEPLN